MIKIISESRCFSGTQYYVKHHSDSIGLEMRFGVYLPDEVKRKSMPVVMYLSGFTGSYKTFFQMGTPQQCASEIGMVLISPDTSPRKTGEYEKTGKYYMGESASFYLNATQSPWSHHWKMETYISEELPEIVEKNFAVPTKRMGVTGHCMGGLAALLAGLKEPSKFVSVSAFAPICAPSKTDWGKDAFSEYLGNASEVWRKNDPTELIEQKNFAREILIDIGELDEYRSSELLVEQFVKRCSEYSRPVSFRLLPGYDHSTHFVQTFIADHLKFHQKGIYLT
ncbi:S-formylglutathione hydrolase [Photorhabdus sp. CRCIA-P01]|uniref:S-formylglutathione hydrolase n=1 Tax=Photorhabdus sp. CRCIA-P01 TaxID=2019570 RepID=UPI000E5A0BC1|nr:S-formylglutathione hydrolase [Photorhabdus sp. CRCIA-P01]